MKKLNFTILTISFILISYLLSCDLNRSSDADNLLGNNRKIIGETPNESDAPPDKCPIPSTCNNGTGEHFCLNLIDGTTNEPILNSNIWKARVTHTGTDCNGNAYYCNYVVNGGSSTTMGCVLPWYNDNCEYTREVCFEMIDNKTYTGSRTFGYTGYTGCAVIVYPVDFTCDFGGSERNDDEL